MPELVIHDVEEVVLASLRDRASAHGRTAEAEAKVILGEALQARDKHAWRAVNELREKLRASGRIFSDSTELLREDRDR
jgi:plasmid stability protein